MKMRPAIALALALASGALLATNVVAQNALEKPAAAKPAAAKGDQASAKKAQGVESKKATAARPISRIVSGGTSASGAAPAEKAPEKRPDWVDVEVPDSAGVSFDAPVRIKGGEAFIGKGRLYPSPAMYDLNGDGLKDIIVGDLPGRVTVAYRIKGDGPAKWEPETPIKGANGKDIKFNNW